MNAGVQGGMKGAGKSFHMDVVQEHLEKEAEVRVEPEGSEVPGQGAAPVLKP